MVFMIVSVPQRSIRGQSGQDICDGISATDQLEVSLVRVYVMVQATVHVHVCNGSTNMVEILH